MKSEGVGADRVNAMICPQSAHHCPIEASNQTRYVVVVLPAERQCTECNGSSLKGK